MAAVVVPMGVLSLNVWEHPSAGGTAYVAMLTVYGNAAGHSTPAAVARQLTADVEATLTQLTDMLDSSSQGSGSDVNGQSDPVIPTVEGEPLQEAMAESRAKLQAEPRQSIAAVAHDQDASDEQPEESGQDQPESPR